MWYCVVNQLEEVTMAKHYQLSVESNGVKSDIHNVPENLVFGILRDLCRLACGKDIHPLGEEEGTIDDLRLEYYEPIRDYGNCVFESKKVHFHPDFTYEVFKMVELL